MAMLDNSAVVVLSGMFKMPITPKLISAVTAIGVEPINPAFMSLNMKVSKSKTRINEIKILFICPSNIKSVNTRAL